MTKEDVIRMAREAWFPVLGPSRTDAEELTRWRYMASRCCANLIRQTDRKRLWASTRQSIRMSFNRARSFAAALAVADVSLNGFLTTGQRFSSAI